MLNDIISTCTHINIIFNGQIIPADDTKPEFIKLIENSYFAPSYIIADDYSMQNSMKKEISLELEFDNMKEFKGNMFNKILFVLKPKYNWLTLYRFFGGKYQGKCLNLNLGTKTTMFYKYINNFIGDKIEK